MEHWYTHTHTHTGNSQSITSPNPNLGQRFPSKTMEMSLQATIHFPDKYTPLNGVDSDDPFCVGLNTYADVRVY